MKRIVALILITATCVLLLSGCGGERMLARKVTTTVTTGEVAEERYSYKDGRLSKVETLTDGEVSSSVSYEYDENGYPVLKISDGMSAERVEITNDSQGRVIEEKTTLSFGMGEAVFTTFYEYTDENGSYTKRTVAEGTTISTEIYTLDEHGEPIRIEIPGVSDIRVSNSYNDLGQLTEQTRYAQMTAVTKHEYNSDGTLKKTSYYIAGTLISETEYYYE